jgi:hypothetical protein
MILRAVTVTSDREGIEDAIYRFVEGIDKRDPELLTSAFTEDIVFDLGGIDASVGSHEPYEGRDFTVDQLMSHVGKIDSMHAVMNVRIEIDGDQAHLTCYLIGQHHRPGQGASADYGEHPRLSPCHRQSLSPCHRQRRTSRPDSNGRPASCSPPAAPTGRPSMRSRARPG